MKCGLVGPGRTRNGLGPFLATFLERAGLRVVAAAGRDWARTEHATGALDERLGHAVPAFADVREMLSTEPLDVLVIASPPDAHRAALEAALAARVHAFCEKPLVLPRECGAVPELCDRFAAAGLVLAENCQWPEVLPAFEALWPGSTAARPAELAMGLSPVGRGRAMVADSLPHFLSVAQTLWPVDRRTEVAGVAFAGAAPDAEHLMLELVLRSAAGDAAARTARATPRRRAAARGLAVDRWPARRSPRARRRLRDLAGRRGRPQRTGR